MSVRDTLFAASGLLFAVAVLALAFMAASTITARWSSKGYARCRCGARFPLGSEERQAVIDRHWIDDHGLGEPPEGWEVAVTALKVDDALTLVYAQHVPEGC